MVQKKKSLTVPACNNHPKLYKGLGTYTENINCINEWLKWLDSEIVKAANGRSDHESERLMRKRRWFELELKKVMANHSKNIIEKSL